jgi:hypothetical protein
MLCLANAAHAQFLPEPAATGTLPPVIESPCPPSLNQPCTPCPPTGSNPCNLLPCNPCNPCGVNGLTDAAGNPIGIPCGDADPATGLPRGIDPATGLPRSANKPSLRERLGIVSTWDECRPPPHVWVAGEYLYWHLSDAPAAATLAATSLSPSLAAITADPTLVDRVQWNPKYGMFSGQRWSAGTWLGECRAFGLEANIFVLERRSDGFTLASGVNDPVILRPFVNANTMAQDFLVVAFPGSFTGNLTVDSTSRLWGSEVTMAYRLLTKPEWELTPTLGVRYLDLAEDLGVTQNTTFLANGTGGFLGQPVGAGSRLTVSDQYSTHSQFFGGQFGARFGKRINRFTVNSFWKVGLGWVHESSTVSGSTTLRGPGGAVTGFAPNAGLFAVPTNSGRTTADELGVVPEFGLTLGYDVTTWLRLTAGYSALYWSRVARPGSQINPIVNPSQVPASLQFGQGGPAAPVSPLTRSDLWLNGVSFGAMLRY